MEFPFQNAQGEPRLLTLVSGRGGVGKTSLLQVIAATRPGHAAVLLGRGESPKATPHAVCQWALGADDSERPHPLFVVTPNVKHPGDEELALLRRREQSHYERAAKERGGFVFVVVPAARWFSRQALTMHAPSRTVAQYDVRAALHFDDASHCDLTRDTKQALAFAAIASALERTAAPHGRRPGAPDIAILGEAMHAVVDAMVSVIGYRYEGLDPMSWEPVFSTTGRRRVGFHDLPNAVRHAVCMAALPVRTLWAAYPRQDPRMAEGVVAIDEFDLHQEPSVAVDLLATLCERLPRVQWIMTTSSLPISATVDADALLALRREPEGSSIAVFFGRDARTH